MRVTSQFLAVLVVLVILQASAGAYVLQKVDAADALRDESVTNAYEVVLSVERLHNQANQEVAHLLGYLRGASTRDHVEEIRADFAAEADRALTLAEPGSPLGDRLKRILEIEDRLFEAEWGPRNETLFMLIDQSRADRERLLDKNAEHRIEVERFIAAFGEERTDGTLYGIRADLERERVAILEFEVGLGSRVSEGALRSLMYAINGGIVEAAREDAVKEIRRVSSDLQRIAEDDPDARDDVAEIRGNLTNLEDRVAFTRASSKVGETRALFAELDAHVTRAEALGVTVPRGDANGVVNMTLLAAFGHVIVTEQEMRLEADAYFRTALLIQEVVRGSLGVRASSLQVATLEAVALATEEAQVAHAAADAEIRSARVAILTSAVAVVTPVVILGWFIVRRLGERVGSFDVAARAVSEGRFDVPPPPPMNDDFDQLGEAWSRMTAALSARDQELAHKNATLRQSERMATMGSLVAGVAHEVNNPLAFVKTTEEMALMDSEEALAMPEVQGNPKLKELLLNIRDGAATNVDGIMRIEKINRMLKGFASPSRDERELLDLNDVIDGVLIIAHNRLKSRYKVEKDFQPLPRVLGSPQEIGQIILNLVINAADASPEEGTITIETRVDGDRVRATVRDAGAGVSPEIRDRLFTPFATTKPEGSGLGLHISRSIAQAHDGSLDLEDTSQGAAFTLTLPVASGGPATVRGVAPGSGGAPTSPRGEQA